MANLAVVGAAALWGTSGTAQALGGIGDPVWVGAARLVVGAVALLLTAGSMHQLQSVRRCLRRPLLGWTLAAGASTALYQTAFFSAVALTGVAVGTVAALGTAPVATGLLASVLFGERLTRWWTLATALAVAGCVALVLGGVSMSGSTHPGGVGLAVVAGSCYGVYTTAAKGLLSRGVPVVAVLSATLGVGAVMLLPVLATRRAPFDDAPALVSIVWLGLAATAVAYILFARGLRQLPAGTVGTLSLAEPLTAALLGVLVLGERPTAAALAGAAALFTGIGLAAVRPVHTTPPTTSNQAAQPERQVGHRGRRRYLV